MNTRAMVEKVLPPILPVLVAGVAAEIAVRAHWVKPYLVPAPSSVIAALFNNWRELGSATWTTADAALTGFAMSAITGVLLAIALSSSPWVQRALYPYAVFFQTVPIIAVAPLIVIWFGLPRTPIVSAFIVSIFPVIANTLTGLLSTDPALRDLFRLYDAKRMPTLFKLQLPFALPHMFTGLRIAGGLAVIGAIVGEFINGQGIGGYIDVSRQRYLVDKVFAGLLMASLIGVALFITINLLSRLALRHWHASEIRA